MKNTRRYKRKKERKSLLKRKGFWWGVAASVLTTGVVYVLFLSPWLQIEEVVVSGTEQVSPGEIVLEVDTVLSETFLGVRTGGNMLLFPKAQVAAGLLSSFPQLADVVLKRSFSGKLTVEVTERGPVGSWCEQDACFSIDGGGVAFKELTEEMVPVFQGFRAREVVLGEEIIDPSLLAVLLEFRAALVPEVAIAGFQVKEAFQVTALAQEGWDILLDTSQDMAWQLTKLREVLEQKIPEEERGNLEYIDLRFGDRAYIQYRD